MLRALILFPFVLVLVAFGLSNNQTVNFGLWPTDVSIEAPLGLSVLAIAGVFFALGALIVWFPALGHRARARKAEKKLSSLQNELQARVPKVPLLSAPK